MKFDSPIYDRIRVKPDQDRRPREPGPTCEWAGCAGAADHRAPKGRGNEREYWKFCLNHVREYNHSYNYFAGMSDNAVASFQKDALTGHRPTWKMGMVGGKRTRRAYAERHFAEGVAEDPFDLFQGGGAQTKQQARAETERRTVRNAERKALHALSLEIDADKAEVKTRFKELVKRHHPDANGGDRGSEDKLREIIEAYKYLKSVGYV